MARNTKTDDSAEIGVGENLNGGISEGAASHPAAGQAMPDLGDLAGTAKQAANQAKEAAGRVIDQAKDQAASRVDEQRQTAASGLQAVAQAFRTMGEDLRKQEQGPVAQYAAEIGDAVGGQVDRFASYLNGRDIHQLLSETEDLARRSPALFLGGAFVLGLAVSRFLKSSRPAPDLFANMPDPNRALPPASTPAGGAGV